MDVDLDSSELTSRGESSFPITGTVPFDFGFADDFVASGFPIGSSVTGESPAALILPSLDDVVCPGSKAEAGMSIDLWTGSDSGSEGPSS